MTIGLRPGRQLHAEPVATRPVLITSVYAQKPLHPQDSSKTTSTNLNYNNDMKSSQYSSFKITALLVTPLALCLNGSTTVQAEDADRLFPETATIAYFNYKVAPGYLKVYSATDESNDGDLRYYPHSSYIIYTTEGKLVRTVENHVSPSDESPELVELPAGSYIVMARSERDGDVQIRVGIAPGQLAVLNLDVQGKTLRQTQRQSTTKTHSYQNSGVTYGDVFSLARVAIRKFENFGNKIALSR